MSDALTSEALMEHVRALAGEIGPRPAGHQAEARAREYIRLALARAGIDEVEQMQFKTWDTWSYLLAAPALLALAGNALGRRSRLAGGLTSLASAYLLLRATRGLRQGIDFAYPSRPTANLVARIPAEGERRRTIVLIGHTDTNKHRPSFSETRKSMLLASTTFGIVMAALNSLSQLAEAASPGGKLTGALRKASALGVGALLPVILSDDMDGYIDGANDNATALACLLGLGAQLKQQPLQHTEVWLAFTSAEEVGCLGADYLLEVYGARLADAWFIDFEMVGVDEIAYVTRHSSLSYLDNYEPDPESLALAQETSQRYPELGVSGRPMVISEEISVLRERGYRGICLVGVGQDGWLANWHRYSDTVENIQPAGVERAARFALGMLQTLDIRDVK